MTLTSERHAPNPAQRYAVAVLATTAALVLTRNLPPLKDYFAFDMFQGAVFLSAWYGGFGPGLAATALSGLAMNYFLMPPLNAFSLLPADLARLVVFGAVGFMISSLSAKLGEARAQLLRANDTLEKRLKERTEEVLTISGREQQRIGQDLHDGLCQTLTGARLLTDALRTKMADDFWAADLEKIQSRLREAQSQAETVSRGLYPVELEANGLMSALQDLVDRFPTLHPVACRFTCRKPVQIHEHETAVHLFRIAQEAMVNAVKGGKAHCIEVRLTTLGEHRFLTVADDGGGIAPNPERKGMGMKIMDFRARAMGAALTIRPRRPTGTLVACAFRASYFPKET